MLGGGGQLFFGCYAPRFGVAIVFVSCRVTVGLLGVGSKGRYRESHFNLGASNKFRHKAIQSHPKSRKQLGTQEPTNQGETNTPLVHFFGPKVKVLAVREPPHQLGGVIAQQCSPSTGLGAEVRASRQLTLKGPPPLKQRKRNKETPHCLGG